MTRFLSNISPNLPWHVTAFHQDYKMTDPANTTPALLRRAAGIARDAGLRYVYAGNMPGCVGDLEHTDCHHCGERLITRHGYLIQDYRLTATGACPACGTDIPGRWSAEFQPQRTAFPFAPHDRSRLPVV